MSEKENQPGEPRQSGAEAPETAPPAQPPGPEQATQPASEQAQAGTPEQAAPAVQAPPAKPPRLRRTVRVGVATVIGAVLLVGGGVGGYFIGAANDHGPDRPGFGRFGDHAPDRVPPWRGER